ncbi:CocE/NonD family hydrolase, partial [candidate division KSB1 bacterium]|nr:CocE/NonD family hydrolase [candidate division KSB1 bacterium]
SDVLSFVSDELQQPLRVEGCVQGHLFVSSDAPDTDFSLKLMDVFPDGRQMLVTDGIARMRFRNGYTAEADSFLQPGKMVPISITLPPTAIVFNSGHRIMIAVSSSNYNRFEVNPNNALAVNDRTQRRLAVNTVHFGAPSASKISLPVVQSQTSIRPVALGPSEFKVATAYPNPFNQSTCIDYFLLHAGSVTIQVMNIRGQVVRTLYRTRQDEGPHQVLWDGMNDTGTTLASGVYYLLILTKTSRISVKLCLLR